MIHPLSLSLLSTYPHNHSSGIFSGFHTSQISELWIPLSRVQNANAYLLSIFWFLADRVHVVPVKPPLSHPCLIPVHSLHKSIQLCHLNCFPRIHLLTLTTASKFLKILQLLAYKVLQAGCEPDFLASSPASRILLLLEWMHHDVFVMRLLVSRIFCLQSLLTPVSSSPVKLLCSLQDPN